MKWRLLGMFLFASICALANDHGVLDDYLQEGTPGNVHSRYLMKPILEGRPIRVSVSLPASEIISIADGKADFQEKQEKYGRFVADAYSKWFLQAAKAIRKDKREKEFEDILPLLERGITVELVTDKNTPYDIKFAFMDNLKEVQSECRLGAVVACYLRTDPPAIFVKHKMTPKQKIALIHEIGHSLGFSDQYEPIGQNVGRNNSDPVYSTPESQPSIMNSVSLKGFQCGDVDGMINLIDITRGKFHGGQEGWASFCKKAGKPTYYYVRGRAELKPYEIVGSETGEVQLILNRPDGTSNTRMLQVNQQVYSLGETTFTTKETDRQGRVLRASGNHGETKYCIYSYEKRICVVAKGDAWMQLEISFNTRRLKKLRLAKDQFLAKDVRIASEGKIAQVMVKWFNDEDRLVVFNTTTDQASLVVSLTEGKKRIKSEDALHPIGQNGQFYRWMQEQKKRDNELTMQEQVEMQARAAKWKTLKDYLIQLALEK